MRKGFETEVAAKRFAEKVNGTVKFTPLPDYMGMIPYWRVEYESVNVSVYLDTVTLEVEDDNVAIIDVPENLLREYVSNNSERSYDEWLSTYTCDDTEDLYNWLVVEKDFSPVVSTQ